MDRKLYLLNLALALALALITLSPNLVGGPGVVLDILVGYACVHLRLTPLWLLDWQLFFRWNETRNLCSILHLQHH